MAQVQRTATPHRRGVFFYQMRGGVDVVGPVEAEMSFFLGGGEGTLGLSAQLAIDLELEDGEGMAW